MKALSKLSKVGAAVALILSIAVPGVASATALAHSFLDISAFKFRIGNGVAGEGGLILPGGPVTVISQVPTGDVSASLGGGAPTTGGIGSVCQGLCVGAGSYAPNMFVAGLGAPAANFAGSTALLGGDALSVAGSTARTDDMVSLTSSSIGSSQSNVSLAAEFVITVLAGTRLEVDFDATTFLRGFLSASGGSSSATNTWVLTLKNAADIVVFRWTPDGFVGGTLGGTEFADACALNDTAGRNSSGDSVTGPCAGHFEAETAGLAGGVYRLSLRHTSLADSQQLIPEPSSLALISLALLGIGAMSRRRNS